METVKVKEQPSLRKRNNEARRSHYQRQKEAQEWERFEYHSLNEHKRLHGHDVWHSKVIPENELFEAGLIHTFNQRRMDRIRLRSESEAFQYRDYGMDFLAKSPAGTYHACQAKHYTSRKVSANDLGTFLAVLMGQIPNAGYLYTSGPIEINFQECIRNSKGAIVHRELPFRAHRATPPIAEPSLHLRPYQTEAITAALAPGKNVLDIACGLGKTLILGHVLKARRPNRVICVAPLRISVQNLLDRISVFLPMYRHILVDSDAGGTTDADALREALEDQKPVVIYTTFASFKNVVHPIANKSEYLVVDEVHNAVHSDDLCAMINAYADSLSLSATIPEEFYEKVDAKRVYKYNVAEGIRNGYICDYEIVLPYVVTTAEGGTHIDVKVPTELEDAGTWVDKALFLATGMFLYGSRRCVVYLSSCADCDAFKVAMRAVMERYHGSTLWCEAITHTDSASVRSKMLDAFQNDEAFDKYVIASVRILDEAVDLPKCDSEYITCIGDATSDIRTVQRLLRGSRLDPSNPSKKNHMFMWTDEFCKAVNALSILKETDPTFLGTKVRMIHMDYESANDGAQRLANGKKLGELTRFMESRCMTVTERWEVRRLEWVAQYERLGHTPRRVQDGTDLQQKNAAIWQTYCRQAHKGTISSKLTVEQKERLNSTPGWLWEECDPFEVGYVNWVAQYERLGHLPKSVGKDIDLDQNRAARWQSITRGAKKDGKLTMEQEKRLDNTLGWLWAIPDPFEEEYAHWVDQYKILGHLPKTVCKTKDPDQYRATAWQAFTRSATKMGHKRYGKLTSEQRECLDNTPGWLWKAVDKFEQGYIRWVEQYERLGHSPKLVDKATDSEQYAALKWQSQIRLKNKGFARCGKLTLEQKQLLENTPGWIWGEPDAFEKGYEHWVIQYKRLHRAPKIIKKTIDPEEFRAARWQNVIRGKKKGGKKTLTHEQIERLNSTPGWLWEIDAFEQGYSNWVVQYQKLGHTPRLVDKGVDPDQRRAYTWQCCVRLTNNGFGLGKLTCDQKYILNNTSGWLWKSR